MSPAVSQYMDGRTEGEKALGHRSQRHSSSLWPDQMCWHKVLHIQMDEQLNKVFADCDSVRQMIQNNYLYQK